MASMAYSISSGKRVCLFPLIMNFRASWMIRWMRYSTSAARTSAAPGPNGSSEREWDASYLVNWSFSGNDRELLCSG
jgi:hypothetical protein